MSTELESKTDIHAAMKLRHPPDAYCLMFEVASATGAVSARRADAIAVSLWPSRGLYILGYEFKRRRGDWLKELKTPAKADAICKYCHSWTIVVDDSSIVKPDELPEPWGLLIPDGKGGLRQFKRATIVDPAPLDVNFLAALMRAATKPHERATAELLRREFQRGAKHGEEIQKSIADRAVNSLDSLRRDVAEFEDAAGFGIKAWRADSRRVGEVVRDVLAGKHDRNLVELEHIRATAKSIIDRIDGSGVLKKEVSCEPAPVDFGPDSFT